jgi:hypothetical protein
MTWEDAPGWLHEAIRAQGGFTVDEWQAWEFLRRRFDELDAVLEPASGDRPVRHVMASRKGGGWLAGATVEWDSDERPVIRALRDLIEKVARLQR